MHSYQSRGAPTAEHPEHLQRTRNLVYGPLGENTWIIYSGLPCSPCLSVFNHRNSICKDNKCLKKIKPNEVYELIEPHL